MGPLPLDITVLGSKSNWKPTKEMDAEAERKGTSGRVVHTSSMSPIPWRYKIAAFVAACVFVCCVSEGCMSAQRLSYARVEGTVVDANSGAPVAGAHVLVEWSVTFGSHASSTACTWIAATRTDNEGRFVLIADPSRMKGLNPTINKVMEGGAPGIFSSTSPAWSRMIGAIA